MSDQKPAKRGRPATGKMPQRQIRVPDAEWKAYQEIARSAGISVSEWIRQVLKMVANRGK